MRRLTLVASLFIVAAVLLAACVAPAPAEQATEMEEPQAAPEDQPETEVLASTDWYDPAAVGATWINLCPNDPPRYGGTITSSAAARGLAGSGWVSDTDDPYIFNQLVEAQAGTYAIVPELAESWDISDDYLAYTFHLRQGVQFHDGSPFTAEDVKYSWEVYAHPDSASGHSGSLKNLVGAEAFQTGEAEEISGLMVIDDHTIQFQFLTPEPNFLRNLPPNENIFSKESIEGIPFAEVGTTMETIGTGPFKLAELVPDQYYVLERNEDYWAGRPYLDRIIFRFGLRDSMATWVAALEAGEIHVGAQASGTERIRMGENPNISLVGAPFGAIFIRPNHNNLPDKRVRQALLYALDLKAIEEGIWGNEAIVYDWHMFDPNGVWMSPDITLYPYDPQKAKDLLAEAEWDAEKELDLLFYYGDDIHKRVTAAMQQYWSDVGVKVNTQYVDIPTVIERTSTTDDFDMVYGCCAPMVPEDYSARYKCDTYPPSGPNSPRYCSEEYDELAFATMTEFNPEKRTELFYEITEMATDEVIDMPFWQQDRRMAIRSELCNYRFFLSLAAYADQLPHTWYLKE
jgi:peptide/nickel transport system substrate-binding protein